MGVLWGPTEGLLPSGRGACGGRGRLVCRAGALMAVCACACACVCVQDVRKLYLLKSEDWRFDAVPELWEGKNVADFVDPDIEEKLRLLDEEEDQLQVRS
jgi:hypothetical protein